MLGKGRREAAAVCAGRPERVIYLSAERRKEERGGGRTVPGLSLPEGAMRLMKDRKYNWAFLTPGYRADSDDSSASLLSSFLPLSSPLTHGARRSRLRRGGVHGLSASAQGLSQTRHVTCAYCGIHLIRLDFPAFLSFPPSTLYSEYASLRGLSCARAAGELTDCGLAWCVCVRVRVCERPMTWLCGDIPPVGSGWLKEQV